MDAFDPSQVRHYDPTVPSDTTIAGGFSTPADVVLESDGSSVLVSSVHLPWSPRSE